MSDKVHQDRGAAKAKSPALAFRGVGFAYPGGGHRLEGIDLEVPRGSKLALLGPNGSGKTTLLRLAGGELRADCGVVEVCGLDPSVADRRLLARSVAVVGPQSMIGFSYSVEEVVLMGRAPHVEGFRLESQADLDAAAKAIAAMDVAYLSERDFDTLSSGEKQRVAVARALAQEPELILLDEPAAFLDIKHQTELYDLLSQLNREQGLTVVSVLHDLNLASLYFERVAMLKDGRVFAQGEPGAVISYANIREVFDTDVYVDLNTVTGKLNVLPLPRAATR